MADHSEPMPIPDYELHDTLALTDAAQYAALFDDTRMLIVDLVLERAATIKELAEALSKPKGTIGHHVGVLEKAGLIRVVRTKKIRAIEAKYYGRTGRTYLFSHPGRPGIGLAPDTWMRTAAEELAQPLAANPDLPHISTLRYARIPADRAYEWATRLAELAVEFTAQPRAGESTFGLAVALYATDRPHLPDLPSDHSPPDPSEVDTSEDP